MVEKSKREEMRSRFGDKTKRAVFVFVSLVACIVFLGVGVYVFTQEYVAPVLNGMQAELQASQLETDTLRDQVESLRRINTTRLMQISWLEYDRARTDQQIRRLPCWEPYIETLAVVHILHTHVVSDLDFVPERCELPLEYHWQFAD